MSDVENTRSDCHPQHAGPRRVTRDCRLHCCDCGLMQCYENTFGNCEQRSRANEAAVGEEGGGGWRAFPSGHRSPCTIIRKTYSHLL